MLLQRVLTALILAPLAIAIVLWPPTAIFALLCAVAFLAAWWEWAQLSGLKNRAASIVLLLAAVVVFGLLWWGHAAVERPLVLLGGGEFAIAGGRAFWLKTQTTRIRAQEPLVAKVVAADDFARRIEELSTKRLLPLEMLQVIGGAEKRGGILFTRIISNTANGVYSLQIDAQTPNSAELEVYRLALEKLPSVAQATIPKPRVGPGMTTFTLYVTFKPDAIKPATQS